MSVDLKVVILGNSNVGKTCLMHRFISGIFDETQRTVRIKINCIFIDRFYSPTLFISILFPIYLFIYLFLIFKTLSAAFLTKKCVTPKGKEITLGIWVN